MTKTLTKLLNSIIKGKYHHNKDDRGVKMSRDSRDSLIIWGLKNWKIEGIILLVAGLFCVIAKIFSDNDIIKNLMNNLIKFINEERIDLLLTFSSISIGIYVTIITIIATSTIGITEDILRKRKSLSLLRVFFSGLMENLLLVIILCFIDVQNITHCFSIILFGLILITFISFIKFIFLIKDIFLANMKSMVKNIIKENKYSQDIINLLEDIKENTKNTQN